MFNIFNKKTDDTSMSWSDNSTSVENKYAATNFVIALSPGMSMRDSVELSFDTEEARDKDYEYIRHSIGTDTIYEYSEQSVYNLRFFCRACRYEEREDLD